MVQIATFVGPIAERAEEITQAAGGQAGTRTNQAQATVKKNAWRLASFIMHVQQHLGKEPQDVTWAGSPAVQEQLLASVQAALVALPTPNWTSSSMAPIVDLIVRVQKLAQMAERALSVAHDPD